MSRFVDFLRNFVHVLSSLKREKAGKRVCPLCGSPEIRLSHGWSGWLTPEHFSCAKCGYSGPLVMEVSAAEGPAEEPV